MRSNKVAFLLRAAVALICVAALIVLVRPNGYRYANPAMFAFVTILVIDLATWTRGVAQNALVMLATLGLGLTGLESYWVATTPVVDLETPGLWGPDPNFGVRAVKTGKIDAKETVDGKPIYATTYEIDDSFRRMTRSPADGPKVRFFGDSYTFGVGIGNEAALPQAFADLTGANVLNFGYPGYGPAQTLRAFQLGLYDKDLEGSQLFILQTAPFHVERTACLASWTIGAPRYAMVDGKVDYAGRCKSHFWQSWAIYQHLLAPFMERPTHADVENYAEVVAAVAEQARTKYKVPLVILFMTRDDPNYLRGTGTTAKDLADRFRAAGAIVVTDDTTAPLDTLRIPGDGHPNAEADRLLARQLRDAVAAKTDVLKPAGAGVAASP